MVSDEASEGNLDPDPQATWVARPGVDPFSAYDANHLIATRLASSSTPWAPSKPNSGDCRDPDDGGPRRAPLDLRPRRLAGDTVYGVVRLLKCGYRNITPHVPVSDKSERPDGTFSRADFVFDQGRNIYVAEVERN